MSGDLDLEAGLAALLANAADALHEAVVDGPFAEAQANVPKESGALEATGKVSDPVIDGDTATVVMSWGNPDDATGVYAIVQHERLDLQHPNGGTAKWAENAQLAAATGFAAAVAAKMGSR
jgi:hypothetical protein